MDTTRWARYAPLTGVAFTVLTVAGVVVMGEGPDFAGKPEDFADYYTDDSGRVIFGNMLMGYALFFLIWFLGSVGAASRRAEGGDGRVSRLAYGGGLVGTTLMLASVSAGMMAALRADDKGISEDVAVVYGDLSSALGFIGGPWGFGALLLGVALVNTRTPFLPGWLTWVSGLLALGLLVGFVAWVFMLLLPLWTAIVGVVLFRQGASAPADTAMSSP